MGTKIALRPVAKQKSRSSMVNAMKTPAAGLRPTNKPARRPVGGPNYGSSRPGAKTAAAKQRYR